MPPKVRRIASSAGRSRLGLLPVNPEEKPADAYQHFTHLDSKKRQHLFEAMNRTKLQCSGFLQNLEKNRQPLPIREGFRVKTDDYVPALYAKLERDEYVIWQAPTKASCLGFWINVWKDNVKLILSLSEKVGESDTDKCYSYWPTKEGSSMTLENGRYTIKLLKKNDHKGFYSYDMELTSTDEVEASSAQKKNDKSTEEEGDEDKKNRQVTLFHYDSWVEGTWPNIDTLATCIQTLTKKEMQILRNSKDQFTPPVILQGFGGVGRTAVAWVSAILMKDVEKKDCFDIPNLIKSLIKLHPPVFHNKLYHLVTYAVGFRCAGLTNWLSEDETKKYVKEIETAYKDAK